MFERRNGLRVSQLVCVSFYQDRFLLKKKIISILIDICSFLFYLSKINNHCSSIQKWKKCLNKFHVYRYYFRIWRYSKWMGLTKCKIIWKLDYLFHIFTLTIFKGFLLLLCILSNSRKYSIFHCDQKTKQMFMSSGHRHFTLSYAINMLIYNRRRSNFPYQWNPS